MRAWREIGLLFLAAVAILVVVRFVDLAPRVESDFFFSTEDPQLRSSEEIAARFPSKPQLILRAAAGDVRSPEYAERIGALTKSLAEIEGVASVQSLTRGPSRPAAAFGSPFWGRLLVGRDEKATNLVALIADDANPTPVVAGVERAASANGLEVRISGVPYVVEHIRRALARDLRVFSVAALIAFGLLIGLLFRSARVVLGTLATCLLACAVTLGVLGSVGFSIGVLTANLVTIVFVLTLSHTVFLTSNWTRSRAEGAEGRDAVRAAVHLTFQPSFWQMMTAFLSFLSLLFASAKPLRELGTAGALGTVVALVVAYAFYPPFLRNARTGGGLIERLGKLGSRPAQNLTPLLAVLVLLGLGAWRLSTDPSLMSYFRPDSELSRGLAAIDADGGLSPLSLVVHEAAGERIDSEPAVAKLRALQTLLEKDPAVGVVLSAVPLLEEARKANALAAFLPSASLLDLLATPSYDRVANSFVTPDRKSAHFFMRMREGGRTEGREVIVERLLGLARESGLEPELAGGLFDLQGKLSALVGRSLFEGLVGLLVLFGLIGWVVARSVRTSLAMLGALALVPLATLGALGWLGMPLDFISSPGAQVAIGIGVDSMIQLAAAARRSGKRGLPLARAWGQAREEMGGAVVAATLTVALGFGLFALSSFPPTQRFGFAVALGATVAAFAALWVLPRLAGESAR